MNTDGADDVKRRQRALWSVGDYGAAAPQYEFAAEDLVGRLELGAGARVLDIATGTGNAAIAAARAGADVVGVDLTPELFDEADGRAMEHGLSIEWLEADAEALPFPDASFDAAVATFGLLFVPRPEVAAAELVRVLRPGGRFGLCNWSFQGAVLAVADALRPPGAAPMAAAPPMLRWGDPEEVRRIFAGLPVDLTFDHASVSWVFESAEEGVRWLEEVSGPVIAARELLRAQGAWAERRAALVEAVAGMTRPDLDGVWITAGYLVTLGRRTDGA